MTALFDRLVQASLEGSLLIAGVWLVCRFAPALPASFRVVLWWLAMLKLLVGLAGIDPIPLPILPAAASALCRGDTMATTLGPTRRLTRCGARPRIPSHAARTCSGTLDRLAQPGHRHVAHRRRRAAAAGASAASPNARADCVGPPGRSAPARPCRRAGRAGRTGRDAGYPPGRSHRVADGHRIARARDPAAGRAFRRAAGRASADGDLPRAGAPAAQRPVARLRAGAGRAALLLPPAGARRRTRVPARARGGLRRGRAARDGRHAAGLRPPAPRARRLAAARGHRRVQHIALVLEPETENRHVESDDPQRPRTVCGLAARGGRGSRDCSHAGRRAPRRRRHR